jgi:hypothetical protein
MEYQGITFTVVQTISKGWRWSVNHSERERAGTAYEGQPRSVKLEGASMRC